MNTIRQDRLTSLLFEELSIMVPNELEDPKLKLVRVTDVRVSRDLRNVKVYVTHDDDEVTRQDVLHHLKRAIPYLRSQIATRCSLRLVPELFFHYDDTPEKAMRVDDLLRQIADERDQRSGHSPADSAPTPSA